MGLAEPLLCLQHQPIASGCGLVNVSSTEPNTFPEDGQGEREKGEREGGPAGHEDTAGGQAGLVWKGAAHVGMERGRVGTAPARLFGQAAFSISKPFFPL